MQPATLILGLGNVLMTDEAVGAKVLQQLSDLTELGAHCTLMDGGTLSFTLAGPIGDCERLIVVDAAAMGTPPGSVRVFEDTLMDERLRTHAKSVHEVSLADLMDMVRLTDQLPAKRALVGIEPQLIDWGEQLTPAVAAAVPHAVAEIQALLARWEGRPSPTDGP